MLSKYHQRYNDKPNEELIKRLAEKEKELILVNEAVKPIFDSSTIDIAVMGCGDKRFINGHKEVFTKVFKKPVNIKTFDIVIDHLEGAADVFQHDCTLPLPFEPYDITFAHVLLRFIPKEKQWYLVKNSYDCLKQSGIAIHVLDPEDYETTDRVDLPAIMDNLSKLNIKSYQVELSIGQAIVLQK